MAYVNVHYGPYEACGVVRHRTQRLRGLKEQLECAGHTVELIPSPHWDRCVIEICHRNVFRCRITNFEYNTDGIGDKVCERAMNAVNDAIVRMRPSFFYPDIPLFSEDFFMHVLCEAFTQLNIRGYIDECIQHAVARVAVAECLDFLIGDAMRGEYIKELIGEAIEVALQNDYMRDLIEVDLQRVFGLHDAMAEEVFDAFETREIIKDTIMEALMRTHPVIKEFINSFLGTTFEKTCSDLDLSGGSLSDLVQSSMTDQLKKGKRLGIKHILDKLVDQLSLRSRTSTSVRSQPSYRDSNRSLKSYRDSDRSLKSYRDSDRSSKSYRDSDRSFKSHSGEESLSKRSTGSYTEEDRYYEQRSEDSLKSASHHSNQSI